MQEIDLDSRLVSLPDADQNFHEVLSYTGDDSHVCLSLNISADLGWFRGHFPDQPVLPGVIQLHWAVLVAQAYFGMAGVPTEVKRLKYKSIVTPPQILDLTVSTRAAGEIQFNFGDAEAKYSEGRLVFTEDPEC